MSYDPFQIGPLKNFIPYYLTILSYDKIFAVFFVSWTDIFRIIVIYLILQTGMAQKWEASSMSSADGETIPFVGPTPLEGPVEAWLCDIEKNMRLTLKEQLKNTRTNLKRMLNKRDKWIKEHFGQVCTVTYDK